MKNIIVLTCIKYKEVQLGVAATNTHKLLLIKVVKDNMSVYDYLDDVLRPTRERGVVDNHDCDDLTTVDLVYQLSFSNVLVEQAKLCEYLITQ